MKFLASGIAFVCALVLASPVLAGHLGREDLLQIDETFTDTNQPAGVNGGASLSLDDSSYPRGSVFFTATTVDNTAGFVFSVIQGYGEQIKRSPKKASFDNKKNSFVSAFTYFGGTGDVQVEKCKYSIQAKGDADVDPFDGTEGKWKASCDKKVLDDLGVTPEDADAFAAIIKESGAKGVSAKNLSYKGKGE